MGDDTATDHASQPNYGELIGIVAAGVLHITTELTLSVTAARIFNAAAAVVFLVYLVWRASTSLHVLRIWGIRRDNFWSALQQQLWFGIPGMLCLVAYGANARLFPPPGTFWLAALPYLVWGLVQQFALQNLLARNLRQLVRPRLARVLLVGILFGLVHAPLTPIVVLTTLCGIFMTWIYEIRPNLWAAGCVHGALGVMAYYFVLGRDPGARIWEFFFG